MKLWPRKSEDPRAVPQYWAIGSVRNVARDGGRAEIELSPEFVPALQGLAEYSHIWVVFALDQVEEAARATLRQYPPGAPSALGVFALRTQARPNPIGIAAVRILGVSGAKLRVEGLDATRGTPVLDLKPYIPHYDSIPNARVPVWIRAALAATPPGLMPSGTVLL